MKALCFHGNKKKNPYKTQIILFFGASKKQCRHREALISRIGSTVLPPNPNLAEESTVKKRMVSRKEITYYLMFLW